MTAIGKESLELSPEIVRSVIHVTVSDLPVGKCLYADIEAFDRAVSDPVSFVEELNSRKWVIRKLDNHYCLEVFAREKEPV